MKDETKVIIQKGNVEIITEKAKISYDEEKISASAPSIVILESDK